MSTTVSDIEVERRAEPNVMRIVLLLGRILFSLIFVLSSINHFRGETVAYVARAGLPLANVLVPLSGILALLGGLMVMLGFRAKLGAWMLVVFLVPVTLIMHAFWSVSDPMMRLFQQVQFMKNLALLGGAFIIAYFGSGPLSLDARRANGRA